MQSILPNAITLQIYRHILTLPTPVKRIGFTWCNKYSVKTFTFLDMLSYLENSKHHPPAGTPKDQWLFFVDQEIEALKRRPKDDIIKLNIFLTDLSCFPIVNQIMAEYFSQPYPARAAVGVKELPKGALVEMDAIVGVSAE